MRTWRQLPASQRRWAVYDAVRRLQPYAHGAAIQTEIEEQHAHDISAGRLYTFLDGLVQEGYLRMESKRHPDPETDRDRGHRKAQFFYPTGKPRPVKKEKSAIFDGRFAAA